MKREYLEGLGLEKEVIDGIMGEHGKAVNAVKSDLTTVTTERDGLLTQIEERDIQLKELKKVDPKVLQAEIERLEGENETTKTEYQKQLDQQAFDFSLERSLVGAKVRNPKAVKALLDTESIKLDGEKLLGLDDQLTALQESDPYLFDSEDTPNPTPQIVAGGNPNGGGSGTLTRGDIMKEKDTAKRQQLIQKNPHLFK